MIKYICDECGQEVVEQEAIGDGVVQNYPDNPYMGKRYEYVDEQTEIKLVLSLKKPGHDHFCKGCMWKVVERMIDKWGPQVVEDAEPRSTIIWPASEELFNEMPEIDDLSKTHWQGAAVGPFTVKFEATGMPDPPFFVKVVPNEETDSSPEGSDTDLPQLYFEGVLQETGPDAIADDPGPEPMERDVPNSDTSDPANWVPPTSEHLEIYRPGWRHPHLP